MEKIDVMLFGDGSKGCPVRAEIITCDHCNECSFYKEKTCLRRTSFLANTSCKFGDKITKKGYTKYASKYSSFMSEYRLDDKYGALKRPAPHNVLGIVGEYVVFNLPIVEVRELTPDKYSSYLDSHVKLNSGEMYELLVPWIDRGPTFILKSDLEDISQDGLLYKLFTYCPLTIFDRKPIDGYKEKTLPYLVEGLKKYLPDLANRFFTQYPQFNYQINYVGRKAYVNTLPIGTVLDHKSGKFTLVDKETLICENYHDYFLPFGCKEGILKIKLNGTETVEITDNNQVDINTKFIE